MSLPEPVSGLVIRYEFLWPDEASRGRTTGAKDRPCVIIVAVRDEQGHKLVTVAPITHSPPHQPDMALEIPAAVKSRLDLDDSRSWVVAAELNTFVWPGSDLRPVRRGSRSFAHGLVPYKFFEALRLRVLSLAQEGRSRIARRD